EVIEESMDLTMEEGRMLFKNDRYKIIIGNDLASKKLFSRKLRLGDKLNIGSQDFEIVGILEKSASPLGNDFILMNDKPMRDALDIGDEVDIIAAQVFNVNEIENIAVRVEKDLRKHRDVELGKEDFSVQTPAQAVETLNNILNYVTWFLVFIAMISLVVGAVGISNTMFTAVLERRKEIGIMKSIGAKNSNILLLFLIESGVLGLVGGIIGIIVGVALSKSVEILGTLILGTQLIQAHYTMFWILGPLVFSFIIGSLSGALPAMQAAKMKPVDALRA
ncbi:MAG: ABC transporter permease, partial [Nanoarchaeota archaeon]|nr:ABC transporter permease [Nanoarchaeota archaeon]